MSIYQSSIYASLFSNNSTHNSIKVCTIDTYKNAHSHLTHNFPMLKTTKTPISSRMDKSWQGLQQNTIRQGSANYSELNPVLRILSIVCGCICTPTADISSCIIDHMAYRAENIHYLDLYTKSLPISPLQQMTENKPLLYTTRRTPETSQWWGKARHERMHIIIQFL